MGERRILVIGSQCEAKGELSFLPHLAEEFYKVMTDPTLGGCVPALNGDGLMIDPSVTKARTAIKDALRRACEDEATLFLAFIGHGERVGSDFYFLPIDASAQPEDDTAIHLVNLIKGSYRRQRNKMDGLVVLLDCCYSGVAADDAATRWGSELHGTLRYEVLTAVADRTAADGCFTENIVKLIRNGMDPVQREYLRCENVKKHFQRQKICPHQEPQHPTLNADEGLYLARNAAWLRKKPWAGAAAETVERLTAWLQPTPQLAEIVEAVRDARCVLLTGPAGTGKSALAAALARSEVTEGIVPAGFVQAIAFITSAATSQDLALQVSEQLKSTVLNFAAAYQQFRDQTPVEVWKQLEPWQREVREPLHLLPLDRPIRIVIDGLDQLPTGATVAVYQALGVLTTDPALTSVRLLVTTRPDMSTPSRCKAIPLGRTDDGTIWRYLERRKIPANLQHAIVSRTRGNWLIAHMLADRVSSHPDCNPQDLPPDLVGIYEANLRDAGAGEDQRWRAELRPVLAVLAAAGVGPTLPMPLLCVASSKLGGPDRPFRLRDILVDLRGLVIRGSPGTENEHVGLFHQTFADYLLDPTKTFGIDAGEPHGALAEAIGELAPMEKHDQSDSLHRYAMVREADHLWGDGRHPETLKSLSCRESAIPVENLARWQHWTDRIAKQLGKNDAYTFSARHNVAAWTLEAGDAPGALRLLQELLSDMNPVLGKTDQNTLITRSVMANAIGETGNEREALQLSKELLPDLERVLGKENRHTLAIRNNIASWTGKEGDARSALTLSQELLLDVEGFLGKDDSITLTVRSNIAGWEAEIGNLQEALQLFKELLSDAESALSKDHPQPLTTRHNIAIWTGKAGDAKSALTLLQGLLPDLVRVLGMDHSITLTARSNIAYWMGETGDALGALRVYQQLLLDMERVRGKDHLDTLTIRSNIADLTGKTGDAPGALLLFQKLLCDVERVLYNDHPQALAARHNIGCWMGEVGDWFGALRQFRDLLPDQERVLGEGHPQTLKTRVRRDFWQFILTYD